MSPSSKPHHHWGRTIGLASLLWTLSATALAAGVYKWVDRQGIVHYDDRTLSAERLTRATIAKRAVAAEATARAPQDFVEDVARQCADVSTRSASYAEARELYGRDPVGNQYRFSDYQLALERARLAHETRRYCQPLAAEKLLAEARAASQQALRSAAAGR